MTLKEKFDALMKNHQSISFYNQELENQKEFLRCLMGEVLKQKNKFIASPFSYVCEDEVSEEGNKTWNS